MLVPEHPQEDPKTCEHWICIDDPNILMTLLQSQNRTNFGQSKNCTLTSQPLDFTMKFSATCPVADAILEGTYLSDTLSHSSAIPSAPKWQQWNQNQRSSAPPTNTSRAQSNPELLQNLLDSLQYKSPPDAIPYYISEEEYKGKLNAWDERTSTSPTSNMHLGHLHADWAEHTYPGESQQANLLETKWKKILDGHLTLFL